MEHQFVDLVFYVVFLFSVTFHEAAHAWAALRGGDPTAYAGGQVSLDPIPHIRREPFGMVLLPILSLAWLGFPFGYASTPYDPAWAYQHPRRAAWMALAGPGANLALVLITGILIRVGIEMGILLEPPQIHFTQLTYAVGSKSMVGLAMLLSVLFSMNLLLFTLNLIPMPPLDGSGAIGLFVEADTARRFQEFLRQPMISLVGILIAWRIFDFLFSPVFVFAANLLYPSAHYG